MVNSGEAYGYGAYSWWIESNAWYPRLTATMILSGIGGPHIGFGVIVGLPEEAAGGGLEIDDRAEDPAFEAPGQLGEEALYGIEPGGRGRCKMKDEARTPGEPGAHLGVLVGRVIIKNDVDHLAVRDVGLDRIEKAMNS
jgi:hypothetical protein